MSDPSSPNAAVEIFSDAEALARGAAELVLRTTTQGTGPCAISLSGGSTPKRLYEILATEEYSSRMPWSRIHWFWGDERFVPHDDPNSNYGMTRKAMLDHVPATAETIHPVSDQGSAEEAAAAYEAELKRFYGADVFDNGRPLFDLMLLGIGEDGHTASLVPGAAALEERVHWVSAVTSGRPEPRVTLTYPALNSSRVAVFLAAGEAKRPVLDPLLAGRSTTPAAGIRPVGRLLFMLDRAAAPAS